MYSYFMQQIKTKSKIKTKKQEQELENYGAR